MGIISVCRKKEVKVNMGKFILRRKCLRKLVAISTILLTVACFLTYYINSHQTKANHSEGHSSKVAYDITEDSLKDSKPVVFGDKNQFVLAPSKAHVTQNYIADLRFVSYKGKDVTVQKTDGSEYILVTLDLNDNFKRKEYDLYKATEAYKKDAKIWKVFDYLTYEGKDLAIIALVKDDVHYTIDEYVGVDLSNGKVEALPEELSNFYNDPNRNHRNYNDYYSDVIWDTSLNSTSELYELSVLSMIWFHKGDSGVGSSNEAKTLNLFTDYPDFWNKIYGHVSYSIYPRPESVSAEEWLNATLHWLAPAGGEDLTVYAVKDGKKTDYPIKSYADLEVWKAWQPTE